MRNHDWRLVSPLSLKVEMRHLHSLPPSRLQMLEREMAVREKEVEAIQAQAKALAQEDQGAGEVERTSRAVEAKFRALCQPMKERCQRLHVSREQHQFHRDVEDEIVSLRGWA